MPLRRLAVTSILALSAATGLAACGGEENIHVAHSEGVYVTTGDLQYQVQMSRQLNPHLPEDQAYLVGVPGDQRQLANDEEWFGVFLRAFNRSDRPQQSAKTFYITDTTGKRYDATPLDGRVNVTMFRSWVLKPGDQLPVPGTPARELATQGGLILFKVPISAYDTRPLQFHIDSPSGGEPAAVDLDV
jgi:hypothetical protein